MLFAKDVTFVSDVILGNLPLKRKKTNTGFLNVNCPMCHLVGNHRPDTKMRCGIMMNPTDIGINCFNCGFKAKYTLGTSFSPRFKEFLKAIGVDDMQIKHLNHVAFTLKHMLETAGIVVEEGQTFTPSFPTTRLPPGSKSFDTLAAEGCTDPDFLEVVEYAYQRGEELANSTTFFWTPVPDAYRMNRRLIIPFYHEGNVVGYTGRIIDNVAGNRYHTYSPPNYLFNNHVMKDRNRSFLIVQEGPTDALSIDGIATLGAHLNEQQAQWLKSTGKKIVVVPDRDESGQRLIDEAAKHRWFVAFPKDYWEPDVKDTAEAVKRYGRLYTLTSIVKSATDQPARINVLRRLFK